MANMDKVKEKAKEEEPAGATQLAEPDKITISGPPKATASTGTGTGTGAAAAGTSDFERLIKAIEGLAGIKTLTIQAPPLQPPASDVAVRYAAIARDLRTVFQATPDSSSLGTTIQ